MAQTNIDKKPMTLKSQSEDILQQDKKIAELEALLKSFSDKHELVKKSAGKKKYVPSKKEFDHDMELLHGTFRFMEVPGGELAFTYGKYEKKTKTYKLKDGEVYSLPRCVAKHLYDSGRYPVHEYQTDINGVPVIRIGRMKTRYTFDSSESRGNEQSLLVTAEKVIFK